MFQPTANQALNAQVAATSQPQDGNTTAQAELRAIWVLQLLAKQEESRKQYGHRHPLEVSEIGQKFFSKH